MWNIQLRMTGRWKASWMLSKLRPRVSGITRPSTTQTPSVNRPKRKYAPKAELASRIGVMRATSQLASCHGVSG
jgi:hypothetical protein